LASCVGEKLLSYIWDAGTPKAACENLEKIFAANTTARKLQLRQELSSLRQRDYLASKFGAFGTALCARETTSSLFALQSMLLVEENHAGASTSTHTDSKMLYTEGERPRARGGQSESVRNGGDRRRRHQRDAESNPRPSGSRGRRGESAPDCWYSGKKGHQESDVEYGHLLAVFTLSMPGRAILVIC
jgi:hypothetical protein